MKQPSVIIAGAGPIGLTAALLLGSKDIRVTVLEADDKISDALRASTWHPPTLDMLAPYGITDRMLAAGLLCPNWQIRMHPSGDRAVALAWFEHLVGDVHQPLHVTARLTAFEQQGDHGGNDFCLGKNHAVGAHACSSNLHAFWDDLLTTRRKAESVDTIAASLRQKHGQPFFLSLGQYDGWARESYQLATTKAYPVTLFRRAKPTDAYTNMALTEAEARLALAGYRLGAALNSLLR